MTYKHSISLGAVILTAVLAGYLFFSIPAHANPLRFPPAVSTATATTTPVYLSAGAATTTLATYDTYASNGVSGGGSTQAIDKVAVLIQHTASTSAGVGSFTIEHSMDGIDWYGDDVFTPSSSASQSITNPVTFLMVGNTTASTSLRVIQPMAPLRYLRVRGTVATVNGALWVSIQPQKQNP